MQKSQQEPGRQAQGALGCTTEPLPAVSLPRQKALDVVIVHRFTLYVTVVDEDHDHALEDAVPRLAPLRDLLANGLHADVSRELALPPRGVDGGCRRDTGEEGWYHSN